MGVHTTWTCYRVCYMGGQILHEHAIGFVIWEDRYYMNMLYGLLYGSTDTTWTCQRAYYMCIQTLLEQVAELVIHVIWEYEYCMSKLQCLTLRFCQICTKHKDVYANTIIALDQNRENVLRENQMIVWCVGSYSTSWVPSSATQDLVWCN